ncbi:hypothetical protein [Actinomadura litoris]|uniref:hypothetical protein n=1 Tax=Actinomadura litoris TaxID=2678616 RepID=UPI001FA6BB40|nr:hypothetical protein [Actinomadura litoris]
MAVLRNTVTDADGDKANLTFEVWTTDAAGKPKEQVKLTDDNQYGVLVSDYVDSGKTAEVAVDSGKLKPGVTYVFRTSAYDGSLYETSWSPWAKFKIRDRAVDIKLPEPDRDASTLDQDQFQLPQEIPQPVMVPADVPPRPKAGTRRLDGREGWNCGEINVATGIQPCSRIVPDGGKKARKAIARAEAATRLGSVEWCRGMVKAHIKRLEACISTFTYEYEGIIIRDGKPTGEIINASWAINQQYELSNSTSQIFEELTLFPVEPIDPRFGSVTLNVDFFCRIDCTTHVNTTHWDSPLEWIPGDVHFAKGTIMRSWNDSDQPQHVDYLDFSTKITGYAKLANPAASQWETTDAQVRCDTVSQTSAGCTFHKYVPTWTFNTKKFPAAAAHAWLVQAKLPNHPGSKQHGKPMFFLPVVNSQNHDPSENRKVICPQGWAKKYGHPETTLLTDTDLRSCDEFAFAASYNSGGMPAAKGGLNPVISGDQCLQSYSKRVKQGEWHLYDDERKPAPTFAEVCGRSAMSNWVNTQSMQAFPATFSQKYRLLDRDPYWINTPGFEDCNAAAATVQCTAKP